MIVALKVSDLLLNTFPFEVDSVRVAEIVEFKKRSRRKILPLVVDSDRKSVIVGHESVLAYRELRLMDIRAIIMSHPIEIETVPIMRANFLGLYKSTFDQNLVEEVIQNWKKTGKFNLDDCTSVEIEAINHRIQALRQWREW